MNCVTSKIRERYVATHINENIHIFWSKTDTLSLQNSTFFSLLEPHFVGSFDIGDYVYFFFRESAVEYINCGKNIYSRVARVCKVRTANFQAFFDFQEFQIIVSRNMYLFLLVSCRGTQVAKIYWIRTGPLISKPDSIVLYQGNFHFISMKYVCIND